MPPDSLLSEVSRNIIDNGGNLYVVPSFSDTDTLYNVDMDLGICDCAVGKDGSPCKHQYLLWKTYSKGDNFLPYISADERKQCSYLAIGETLADTYYEGLHDYVAREQDQEEPDE